MTKLVQYVPPQVWQWSKENGGKFAHINRPIAGPTHQSELPVGKHPIQLYSRATPNGVKVTILLEELLARGHVGAEYDAWLIQTWEGDQFGSGFVEVNPNSKIPALVDYSGRAPLRVFESGSILLYLAEKFSEFLPNDLAGRTETLNWLFWQMGGAPFVGGGFGHFYAYAPTRIEYAIDRFAMETKRQMDVLDRQLADRRFIIGDKYTIADIAIWPWFSSIVRGQIYDAVEFLQVNIYKNLSRWVAEIGERPAVQRGWKVNRTDGAPGTGLRERHDGSDFDDLTVNSH
jgi:GST-like protein